MMKQQAASRLQAAVRARQAWQRALERSGELEMAAAFAELSSSDSDIDSDDYDAYISDEEASTCLNNFGDPQPDDDFTPWHYSDGEEIDYM